MLQSVRGTHDLLPEAQAKHNTIIGVARSISERFGFQEMSTPIFEFADVFKRTLGEASDIVNKEMYTFKDRNDEEITLRPEGTAPIARAFISEGLSQRTPLKLFYQGPMFRYERPQKGRQRQFHQFGAELLGVASPYADVECLTLAHEILRGLDVLSTSRLEINSIGDDESRAKYTAALVKYLTENSAKLSEESQRRLTANPLRILDSKSEGDQALLKNAPLISDFYNETSKTFFDTICTSLKNVGIPFHVNPFLVRGLDYYTHCVFEYRTSALGAQDAILSGGRYDGLIEQMGGPSTPGFGWAAGIERLAMLSPVVSPRERPLAVIPVHSTAEQQAFELCYKLRAAGLNCEIAFSGNLSKRMKRAAGQNAWAAVVVGPDELARGEVVVKLLDTSEQKTLRLDGLAESLASIKPR
ncbi:MAG: histidine--tRNA ligase [Bdellovibrionales bacterium]